jgi:membrane protease YdiL (CAAX protease family)
MPGSKPNEILGGISRVPLFAALAALALAAGAGTCSLSGHTSRDSAQALALDSLGIELFLGLGALALAALSRQPLTHRLGLGRGALAWRDTVILVLGTLALSHALDATLELFHLREQSVLIEFDRRLEGLRGPGLLLVLVCLGVAPAFGEELLCRGLVQRGIAARRGAPAGVIAGALLFGALHLEPLHALFALGLGLYLGLTAWWSGSIRLPILCHAANNLLAVLGAAGPIGLPLSPLPSAIGGLALALAALWWVAPKRSSPHGPGEAGSEAPDWGPRGNH